MDQDAYRKTYQQVNERYCAFEKGILTNQCACSQVAKLNIAEREAAHCKSDEAQQDCIRFLELLREQARFALKIQHEGEALPHAKAIRLQIGGLRGLQVALTGDDPPKAVISDVAALIRQSIDEYQSLENLPYSNIMQQVAAYQGRKRSRSRKDP